MQNSSDEISVDSDHLNGRNSTSGTFKYLPHWPPVNIEFQDVMYSVQDAGGKLFSLTLSPKNFLITRFTRKLIK